jgi:hypothetical protein
MVYKRKNISVFYRFLKFNGIIISMLGFMFLGSNVFSQQIEIKQVLNNHYLNFFGDASTASYNYERLVRINPHFLLTGKIGIGWRREDESYILPAANHYLTMPYHVTANLGGGRHFFELGLGMTSDLAHRIIKGSSGNFYNYTFKYSIVGYRFQPFRSDKTTFRIYFHHEFGRRKPEYPGSYYSMIPIGISFGKSF